MHLDLLVIEGREPFITGVGSDEEPEVAFVVGLGGERVGVHFRQ